MFSENQESTLLFETKDIVRSKIVMMIEEEFDTWEENSIK
jgi:hypothetical protein